MGISSIQSNVRTSTQNTRRHRMRPARPHQNTEIRIGSDDTSAPLCASQVLQAFRRRLPLSSLASRSTVSFDPQDPDGIAGDATFTRHLQSLRHRSEVAFDSTPAPN